MILLQLKGPLALFVKRWEFLPGFGFLSPSDMTLAVESDVKTHSFLHIDKVNQPYSGWPIKFYSNTFFLLKGSPPFL